MSKYDDERNRILARMQASNVSFDTPSAPKDRTPTVSKYDEERRAMSEPEFQMPEELSALNVLKRLVPGAFEHKPKPSFGKRVLGTLEDIGQGLSDFPEAFTNTSSFGLTDAYARLAGVNTKKEQEERNNRIGGKIGTYAGYVAPGAAADTAASFLVRPLVKSLPKVAKGAVRLGTGGALFGTAQETSEALTGANDQTLGQRALDVGLSAGVGAGLGAAGPLIKAGADIGKKTVLRPLFDGALKADEVLGDVGSSSYTARLKPADRQVYINRIIPELQRRVSESMTPPLENPNELAKWLKPHLGDDVSLNEIRKMGYEDMRQIAEEVRGGLSKSQVAVDEAQKMGIDLPKLLKGEMPTIRGTGDKLPVWAPIVDIKRPGIRLTSQQAVKAAEDMPFKPGLPEPPPEMSDDVSDLIAKDLEIFDPADLKPISGFMARVRDFYRNMERVMGNKAEPYLQSFDSAKKGNIEMQEYWLNRLKTEVVDKLGIKKDSKLSALVQEFGENKITLDQLKEKASNDWEKVVEADTWFRNAYNDLIDIVNDTRTKLYPNSPEKWVPKRQDYYRHFRELEGLEGLKNLFETPGAIDPSLAGISEFTKPKAKFAGFMQRRGLGAYKNDAVGGFLNYIPSASYATHIDPEISKIRSLSDALAGSSPDGSNNNFIRYLGNFADDLSGKTQTIDRAIVDHMPFVDGRRALGFIKWLDNRIKANTILGNAGTVVSQVFNIPVGIADTKQYALPGLGRAVAAAFRKDPEMAKSAFLKERYSAQMYRQFDTNWLTLKNPLNTKKFAEWTMETADRLGTTFIWQSEYAKAIGNNISDPIAYADRATRKIVGGRGIGEVPLTMKSTVGKLIMPFQLEVGNLWHVMHDMVSKNDFTGILILFMANWLFNRGAEQVRGSSVAFDPIQAVVDASQPGLTYAERVGRIGGEVLSNVPLGQTVASALVSGEYNREKYFGDNDPTRFGTGIPITKLANDLYAGASGDTDSLKKAALSVVPGFGGNQIRKTAGGIKAIGKGATFTRGGELKFPVDVTPQNVTRMLLFGENSTPEARSYYGSDSRPLSAKDTEAFLQSEDPVQFYKNKMLERELERIKTEVGKTRQDTHLTIDEKQKRIDELIRKYDEAVKQGSAQ